MTLFHPHILSLPTAPAPSPAHRAYLISHTDTRRGGDYTVKGYTVKARKPAHPHGHAANVQQTSPFPLKSHLCSSGHGAWGQCVPCWGAAKTARGKQIRAGMPAQPPQMPSPKSTLFLSQGGRFAEGSGKRRKIWPRGRFGLIFGAKPICQPHRAPTRR